MKICWFYQHVITRCVTMELSLPRRVEKHVRTCSECRQHHQVADRLTHRLLEAAPRQLREPSPFLHARIMASLDQSQRHREPTHLENFLFGARINLVAMAVILAALLITSIVSYQWITSNSTSQLALDQKATEELVKNLADRKSVV